MASPRSIGVAFVVALLAASVLSQPFPDLTVQPLIAINVGNCETAGCPDRPYTIPGGPYTDSNGIVWAEDYGFSEPWTVAYYFPDKPNIKNTNDPMLFFPCRRGTYSYAFDVPNGNYEINIFSKEEKWSTLRGPNGGRAHWVHFEDQYYDYVDITARAGVYTALKLTYYVSVTDGELNMKFEALPGSNSAIVSAIAVIVDPSNTADGGKLIGDGNWPLFDEWVPSDPSVKYAINVAGTDLVDPVSGFRWSSDRYSDDASGQQAYTVSDRTIQNTELKALGLSFRSGTWQYNLPVSRSTTYRVVLYLMEQEYNRIGNHVFDIVLGTTTVESQVDPAQKAGRISRLVPVVYFYSTGADEDTLLIKFNKNGGARAPSLFGILVTEDSTGAWPSSLPSISYPPLQDRPYRWSVQAGGVVYAINVGGHEVVSAAGFTFYADFGYHGAPDDRRLYGQDCSDGVLFSDCVKNTAPNVLFPDASGSATRDGILFDSLRRSPQYSIPIDNGVYDLIIFAAEDEYANANRKWNVYAEDVKLNDQVLVTYTAAGDRTNYAVKYVFRGITVNDGSLNIRTENIGSSATFNALMVTTPDWDLTYAPPAPPTPEFERDPVADYDVGLPDFPGAPIVVPSLTVQPMIAIDVGNEPTDSVAGKPYTVPEGPYTDSNGIVWSEDIYFDGGGQSYYWEDKSVRNSNDNMLIRTCRTSSSSAGFRYNIPVANGDYEVKMFAKDEKWSRFRGPNGGRAFWVYIEGEDSPFDYVDLFGRAGKYYEAVELTYYITVLDGELNLWFTPIPGQNIAYLCALSIDPDPQNRATAGEKYGHNWPGFDYWVPSSPDVLFQMVACGHNQFPVSAYGTTWSADAHYHDTDGSQCYTAISDSTGGFDASTGYVIDGTQDDWLFSTRRSNNVRYSLPVDPSHSDYMLALYVSDYEYNQIGYRTFHIFVNDELMGTHDIVRECGTVKRLCAFVYFVTTSEGVVDIRMEKAGGSSRAGIINGVYLVKSDGNKVWPTSLPSLDVAPRENRPFNWKIQKNLMSEYHAYYAINVGGPEYVSKDTSLTFYADFGRVSGSHASYGPDCTDRVTFSDCVAGSTDGFLYDTLSRKFVFELPVPNGVYALTLMASEDEYETENRIWNLFVEDVDLGEQNVFLDTQSKNKAWVKKFENISVSDGYLSIRTAAAYNNLGATISALLVEVTSFEDESNWDDLETDAPPPPPPPSSIPISDEPLWPDIYDPPLDPLPADGPRQVPTRKSTPIIAVNCGLCEECGDAPYTIPMAPYTDRHGVVWQLDQGYTGGGVSFYWEPVDGVSRLSGSVEEDLIRPCRTGTFDYAFEVEDGHYEVTVLSKDEKWHSFRGPWGARAFHTTIEGELYDMNDNFARTGVWYHAVEYIYYVKVTDGVLNMHFEKLTGQNFAYVCGISIRGDPEKKASEGIKFGDNWPAQHYWKPSTPDVLWATNACGEQMWTDDSQFQWSIDLHHNDTTGLQCYYHDVSGSGKWEPHRSYTNTNDDRLVHTWRAGDGVEYTIPLNGEHKVRLVVYTFEHEYPLIYHQWGGRRWHILANGELIDTVDIMQECGAVNRLCPFIYHLDVAGDYLNLKFPKFGPSGRASIISAILVTKDDGSYTWPTALPSLNEVPKLHRPFGWKVQGSTYYAINVGGPELVGADGLVWSVDWGAPNTDGLFYYGPDCNDKVNFSDCAKNTADPRLFTSLRRNPKFSLDIPNGQYTVTIYAIEDEYSLEGRHFNVILEDEVAGDIHAFVEAGNQKDTVVSKTFPVTVSDGSLDIRTEKLGNRTPSFGAIRVNVVSNENFTPLTTVPVEERIPPLPAFTPTTTTPPTSGPTPTPTTAGPPTTATGPTPTVATAGPTSPMPIPTPTPVPDVDCAYSWGQWSDCSASCGEGSRTRSITVTTAAMGNGLSCPTDTTEVCNLGPCVVDCVFEWSDYSACSTSCGVGTSSRTPNITSSSSEGGQACPSVETISCNNGVCSGTTPVDCEFTWGDWSTCSSQCGSGESIRSPIVQRASSNGGLVCPVPESIACDLGPCDVDCVYSEGTWTTCSVVCGGGTEDLFPVISIPSRGMGTPCPQPTSRVCNTQVCTGNESQTGGSDNGGDAWPIVIVIIVILLILALIAFLLYFFVYRRRQKGEYA